MRMVPEESAAYGKPVVRHLKVTNLRKHIGMDNLTVTPVDKNGNSHILVIANNFSKHVWEMPAARMDEVMCHCFACVRIIVWIV